MMAAYHSGPSSVAPSISDLDGFTLGRDNYQQMTNSYASIEQDEFGFDPPAQKAIYPRPTQMYSPPDLAGWPGFEREDDVKDIKPAFSQNYEIDRMVAQTLPNATNAMSRFGQITPPRTNSTSSEAQASTEDGPRTSGRKRTKIQQSDDIATPGKATSGRKRKNAKKSGGAEQGDSPEEAKRKASLEKNRLAAAKCRVNKKEKTEQLQRDSHEKGLHNAFLKEQVMRMKSEVQHMHAILLAHANCDGCKSPEEIQKHLAAIGQEYISNHMLSEAFDDYSQIDMDGMPQGPMTDDYFSSSMSPENSAMLHPPLPEFSRGAEFDVVTPMQTD